jgi:4-amino-4-deoxy-L-arabinose transferase-like glycosyltransferase
VRPRGGRGRAAVAGRRGTRHACAVTPTPSADLSPPADRPLHRRRWVLVAAVVALLAAMAVPMVTSAVQQSPTIDEPVYVSAALDYVREHELRRNPEHPPLAKLIMAAGLVVADPNYDPAFDGTQQAVGSNLLYSSGNNPWTVMLAGRLPMIVLTLLFGLVVFGFARDLAGPVGGLTALALYAFTPDLITHGALATLDVPAAGFVLLAAWTVWRARARPQLYLPLAGLALGAAVATRMNTLPVVPVLMLLALLSVRHHARARRAGESAAHDGARRRAGWAPALAWAAAVGVIAVATVWVTYLVVDPRLRWTTPPEAVDVGGLKGLLVDLMPFPEPFRDGMRIQFGFDAGTYTNYLFGRSYRGGRWYYLPAALLVKTPIGMLVLWAAGVVALFAVRRLRPAAPYLLLPPLALYAGMLDASRNYGTRYAIFVPMFLAVAAGCLVTLRPRPVRIGVAALVAYAAVSSAATFPYYLPYANEAFGGPSRTWRHLDDSNVDWGQDLGRLAERLGTRYPGEPVWLSYKGSGLPEAYGIRAGDPRRTPPERVCGLLVISHSRLVEPGAALRRLIATSERIDTVGHSIAIFRRSCG